MLAVLVSIDGAQPRFSSLARRAAQGPTLESKRVVDYRLLETNKFLTACNSPRVPFRWMINPYRGCEFACRYCYARYTHEFLELREPYDFERRIFVKPFDPASFRAELHRVDPAESIAIGTATDPYQPAERRFRITQKILEVFAAERGRRLHLTTKSDLVARDAALLERVARGNVLHIHLTITTVDDQLARLIEPKAPRPSLRFGAVAALVSRGVSVGVTGSPILPLITDSQTNLDALAKAARETGSRSFGAYAVFLKPCAQQVFFPFLEEHFPHLVRRYRERFERQHYLRGAYTEELQRRVEAARTRYRLAPWPADYRPELWEDDPQLSFSFPE
jgi:DNA repair photolyase